MFLLLMLTHRELLKIEILGLMILLMKLNWIEIITMRFPQIMTFFFIFLQITAD